MFLCKHLSVWSPISIAPDIVWIIKWIILRTRFEINEIRKNKIDQLEIYAEEAS